MRLLFYKISNVTVFVSILLVFFQGCEKKFNTVIDSTGSAPILSNAILSPSPINTDTINIGTVRKPDDLLTIRIIASVHVVHPSSVPEVETIKFSVTDAQSTLSITDGELRNNGLDPDISSTDSIYSGYIEFQIQRVFVGTYIVTFWYEDNSGNRSNAILQPIQIARTNHPPVLSNLIADSLVSLSGEDHILQLNITATDSDGQADVLKVYFNSFKPDGSPATGNPFLLYDDGNFNNHGDSYAGDGIYSLTISLPSTTTIGTYRFEFHAVDRSLDSSKVLIHTIQVTL